MTRAPEENDDPERVAAVRRIVEKLLEATAGERVDDTQIALGNVVTHLALLQGTDECDRRFLETIHQMFSVFHMASNRRLLNEDETVS